MVERWLTIVGIGEDGVAGLSDAAKHAIANAQVVYGGHRHLALAASLTNAEQRAWQSPIQASVDEIAGRAGVPVCVLASGDPFEYGIGATLSRTFAPEAMRTLPAPSSFALAAAALGWPLQDVTRLSLHGRPLTLARPHLHPGRKILALTSDSEGPQALATLLTQAGFGTTRMHVLEALGGEAERVRSCEAATFALGAVHPLNLVALEVGANESALVLPFTPGLPDDAFIHDGQITKSAIRAQTLAALAPRYGEHLWDIGAGAGSVAIEWMLRDPSLSAAAIEVNPDRSATIAENAEALGVPGLAVVTGRAPEAVVDLARPDAIFLGGGGSQPGVMDTALDALKPRGRLVANAVTLEMESLLLHLHGTRGGTLTRTQIARAEPVGAMTGWRPAMPVTQWVWHKAEDQR